MSTTQAMKPMTAEEFWDWWGEQPDEDCRFELDRGSVVRVPLARMPHGIVCANVGFLLGQHAIKHGGLGSSNNPLLLVGRQPDTVLGPDLLFFARSYSFAELNGTFWTDVPAVAAEVLNGDESWVSTSRRVSQLLTRGVPHVWVVDPQSRTVSAFAPGQTHRVLEGDDELPLLGVPASQCFNLQEHRR